MESEQTAQGGNVPLERRVMPPLNDEIEWILGRPCFAVAGIARRLHELKLYDVARKAESEQAAALHWMLNLYFTHGLAWRDEAEKVLRHNARVNPPTREEASDGQ